jgi:hypothetical protein
VIIPPARRPARPAPVAQPCASGGGTVRAWFDPRGQSIPELSCEARSELKALDRSDPVGLWRNVWCEWTQNESETQGQPKGQNGLRQSQRPGTGRSVHCETEILPRANGLSMFSNVQRMFSEDRREEPGKEAGTPKAPRVGGGTDHAGTGWLRRVIV